MTRPGSKAVTEIALVGQVLWERRRDAVELAIFTLAVIGIVALFITTVILYNGLVH